MRSTLKLFLDILTPGVNFTAEKAGLSLHLEYQGEDIAVVHEKDSLVLATSDELRTGRYKDLFHPRLDRFCEKIRPELKRSL